MSRHIAEKVLRLMTKKKIRAFNSNILVMCLTFKENCQDIRNTKMTDAIADLDSFHANIDIYDLWANADEVKHEYGLSITETPQENTYDAVIICVAHDEIRNTGIDAIRKLSKTNHVIFDVKYIFNKEDIDDRLYVRVRIELGSSYNKQLSLKACYVAGFFISNNKAILEHGNH
jgi:UDP-N-acetyl-D-galactosamine dehydrogenase